MAYRKRIYNLRSVHNGKLEIFMNKNSYYAKYYYYSYKHNKMELLSSSSFDIEESTQRIFEYYNFVTFGQYIMCNKPYMFNGKNFYIIHEKIADFYIVFLKKDKPLNNDVNDYRNYNYFIIDFKKIDSDYLSSLYKKYENVKINKEKYIAIDIVYSILF